MPGRDEAWRLLTEWVQSESLRRHMLCVEAAMRAYAKKYGGDPEEWGLAGLLHDLDYERYPQPDPAAKTGHPFEAIKLLREKGYPEEILAAILGHATYSGTPRVSQMAKCLFAVDELCGFLVAMARVRPQATLRPRYKPNSAEARSDDEGVLDGTPRRSDAANAEFGHIPPGPAGFVSPPRSASSSTHMGIASSARLADNQNRQERGRGGGLGTDSMRPDKLAGITPETIRKYLKKKKFAEKVSREEIAQGIAELGLSEEEHFNLVAGALRGIAGTIGLN